MSLSIAHWVRHELEFVIACCNSSAWEQDPIYETCITRGDIFLIFPLAFTMTRLQYASTAALHSCREWRPRPPCHRDVAALALPAVVWKRKRPAGRAPQPNSLQGASAQAPAHRWEHQTSRLSCSGQKHRVDVPKLSKVARSARVAYMVAQFRVISDVTQGNSCLYQFSEHAAEFSCSTADGCDCICNAYGEMPVIGSSRTGLQS